MWIITDAVGHIEEISPDAATLLNLTPRGARGPSRVSLHRQPDTELLTQLLRAAEGECVERADVLRPLERRAVNVTVEVTARPRATGERVHLHWVIARPEG